MNEVTWLTLVLWMGVLVLSQFIRSSQTTQGGLMAFGSLFGFALMLQFMTTGNSLVSVGLLALNLFILYEALERW